MNLLMITPRYYPHIGGMEYVIKSVSERLSKLGYNVKVLTGDPNIEKQVRSNINGIEVLRWPTYAPGNAYHIPMKWGRLQSTLRDYLSNTDVIHVHSIHTIYSIRILKTICRLTHGRKDRPLIILTPYYHGTGHTLVRKFLWKIWRKYIREILTDCVDKIHTVSKLEAKLIKQDFGVSAIPIENGVDEWVRNFKWQPKDYAMYSGRIEKYKNIHKFGEIIKIVNEIYGLNLKLKIFGKGSYRNQLVRYLKKLNLKFSIHPPLPFETYIRALSNACLFGLLSFKESYPQSINEANAMGVPVLITNPWGNNFSNRRRTLLINLESDKYKLAKLVYNFLEKAKYDEPSVVPTWNEVVNVYIQKLYNFNKVNR